MVSFTQHPDVYCGVAKSHRDRAEGLGLLAQPLLDGSWAEHPAKWIQHFSWSGFWESSTRSIAVAHRASLIERIISEERITVAAHASLPAIFNTLVYAPIAEQRKVIAWLARMAEPNDATMLADVLDQQLRRLGDDCVPLVEWLLTKGSSELRSGRRAFLAAQLLPLVASHLEAHLAAAIRFVLYNDSHVGSDAWGYQTLELLLDPVERLARGGSPAIVGDLCAALVPEMLAHYLRLVMGRWEQYPHSRCEVIRRLASGEVRLVDPTQVWAAASAGPPCELRVRDAEVSRASILGLRCFLWDIPRPPTLKEFDIHPDRAAWSHELASEFVRTTGLFASRSHHDIALLRQCVGYDGDTTRGIFEAIQQAVNEAADPQLDEVCSTLNTPGTGPNVVDAALELLGTVETPVPSKPVARELAPMRQAIEALLGASVQPFAGFALRSFIGDARHVAFGKLPNDAAFAVDGDTLLLNGDSLEPLFTLFNDREREATAVLYALHEIVHEWQGIAGKPTVNRVRFAGAEGALMHLDLGADHVAACLAAATFPDWELLWLKELQGRSIRAFPTSARHPQFSRVRKTLRLVGLRTDLAVRKHGKRDEMMTPESYAFADFSPGGGDLVVLMNRPPFAVLKVAALAPNDADALFEGIEGKSSAIDRIDKIIQSALGAPEVNEIRSPAGRR